MKEKQLTERIVSRINTYLDDFENVDVKQINDNFDEQIQNVVIVGVTSTKKLFPMTEDYEYGLEITLRSWICEDESGNEFNEIVAEIKKALNEQFKDYNNRNTLRFVGVVDEGIDRSITETSNIMTFKYLVYASL